MASGKHSVSYKVEIGDGRILRRHLDHIRDRTHSLSTTESSQDDITNPNGFDDTAAHNDLQDFEVSPDQSTDPSPTPPDESPSTGALTARQYPQRNLRKEIATGLIDMVGTLTFNRGGNVVSLRHGTNIKIKTVIP